MPRRGENIYKRKDGRWEGRYIKSHCGNKAKYGYVYGKTYSEVKKKLLCKRIEEETTNIRKDVKQIETPVFEELALLWLDEVQHSVKESTGVKYRNMINGYIIPYLGHLKLNAIDYEIVSELCIELLSVGGSNKQGLSSKTVADVLSIIKAVLKLKVSS